MWFALTLAVCGQVVSGGDRHERTLIIGTTGSIVPGNGLASGPMSMRTNRRDKLSAVIFQLLLVTRLGRSMAAMACSKVSSFSSTAASAAAW